MHPSAMHYFPVTPLFMVLLLVAFAMVVALVEFGLDLEALFRRRVRDELAYDEEGGERSAAPVPRDEAEQPVFDLGGSGLARRRGPHAG